MDAPQYVHADVHSDIFCHRMFYYTHHRDMEAPHYVRVDVPSDYLRSCMSYYTHHRDMYVPQDVSPIEKKGVILLF